jgi:hypothetical protein
MSETYYKAVRPDGTSFNDPSFRWVPGSGEVADIVVKHPQAHKDDASGYLSVATVPTDCTGMRWPARLLIVEPVEGFEVFTPDACSLPNKRAAHAWRVVEERTASDLLGPQSGDVLEVLESFKTATPSRWRAARDVARNAARDVAWVAAWDAARYAARDAGRGAARDAAWDAAQAAAWGAGRDAARDAAWGAARGVGALILRDLVGTADGWDAEAYNALTAPLRAGGFPHMEAL